MDVTSLYTNIPPDEGITVVCEHTKNITTTALPSRPTTLNKYSALYSKNVRSSSTEKTISKITANGHWERKWQYIAFANLFIAEIEIEMLTTVFVDTRLWKTKHPRKRFQNFRQSYVLLTDRIEIHQSQPLA